MSLVLDSSFSNFCLSLLVEYLCHSLRLCLSFSAYLLGLNRCQVAKERGVFRIKYVWACVFWLRLVLFQWASPYPSQDSARSCSFFPNQSWSWECFHLRSSLGTWMSSFQAQVSDPSQEVFSEESGNQTCFAWKNSSLALRWMILTLLLLVSDRKRGNLVWNGILKCGGYSVLVSDHWQNRHVAPVSDVLLVLVLELFHPQSESSLVDASILHGFRILDVFAWLGWGASTA